MARVMPKHVSRRFSRKFWNLFRLNYYQKVVEVLLSFIFIMTNMTNTVEILGVSLMFAFFASQRLCFRSITISNGSQGEALYWLGTRLTWIQIFFWTFIDDKFFALFAKFLFCFVLLLFSDWLQRILTSVFKQRKVSFILQNCHIWKNGKPGQSRTVKTFWVEKGRPYRGKLRYFCYSKNFWIIKTMHKHASLILQRDWSEKIKIIKLKSTGKRTFSLNMW